MNALLLAKGLRQKGLSMAEIANEIGMNLVALKRLLQPELYNALEPTTDDATINRIKRYAQRRQREDNQAA